MSSGKIMLVDGNSLLYRAFYALPLLRTRDGIYTNAVYGFFNMLNRIIAEQQPTHIVLAFDKDKKTFRTKKYEAYKAHRPPMPEELRGQFAIVRDILQAMNIGFLEIAGYEADDIIGTLSARAEQEDLDTLILTGDADTLQLVTDRVQVCMTKKGISEMELYDPAKVEEKWEVSPEKLVEIKALMGDASDNIPGVPGVGAKTAIKLVKEYGHLENIYANLNHISGNKLTERLKEHQNQAFISRELAAIVKDVHIETSLSAYKIKDWDIRALTDLYRRLEFTSLLKSLQDKKGLIPPDTLPPIQYIHSEAEARALYSGIDPGNPVSVYIEANLPHPMWAEIRAVYIALEEEIFALDVHMEGVQLGWLRLLLEDRNIKKYLHNAKFAWVLLRKNGITLEGIAEDTMLLQYVLDPAVAVEELQQGIFHSLRVEVHDQPQFLVMQIKSLYHSLQAGLNEKLAALYYKVELPLASILAEMEYRGVKLDKASLNDIADELEGRIERIETQIYSEAGCRFNINSPKQLGKVLFEDLSLPVVKKTKTGYATGIEVLEALQEEHPIIPPIIEYRLLNKLKSTYVDGLREAIHPQTLRVHTIFKQTITATGRLSSVEPNLQNIPVRMEEGRRIRKAFTPADTDWLFIAADYSQIDLRVLAHISGDQTLIETFRRGIDVHTRTAAEIFKIPLDQVDATMRRKAKAVNFGIIYGISDFGLARDTGVSRQEARQYIDEYLATYPGVQAYMKDIVAWGRKHGYVETILGRRRYLPDLQANNKMVRSFAERMALNTPIQGSSADIIKLAMLKIDKHIKKIKGQAHVLLQVHDELLLEVEQECLKEVGQALKQGMEGACQLQVPLTVSVKYGRNWYDMQEMNLDS